MNIVRVPPPFGTNMQSQNEFHLQTNSLFARNLDWTSGVTLNPGKRRLVTSWMWMNPDCNWDDLFWVKSTFPLFTVYIVYHKFLWLQHITEIFSGYLEWKKITLLMVKDAEVIWLSSKGREVYPLARKDTTMITLHKAILNTNTVLLAPAMQSPIMHCDTAHNDTMVGAECANAYTLKRTLWQLYQV